MAPDPISTRTATSRTWHDVCQTWELLGRSDLAVTQELIPPGSATASHRHDRSRQFFYVLRGQATITVGGHPTRVGVGEGLEVPPRARHAVANEGEEDLELLVISTPRASGRRHAADEEQGTAGRSRSGPPRRQPGAVTFVGSHLRATRASDLDTIVRIEGGEDTRQWLGPGGLAWHERAISDPDMEHWVLVDRLDHVLGFGLLAGINDEADDVVEIRRMALIPEGRGQGLGRLLLRHLLEHALASPRVETVWLDVSRNNTRAQALYRAFGFVEEPQPEWAHLEDNGMFMRWRSRRPT